MKTTVALVLLFIAPLLARAEPAAAQLIGHWRYTTENEVDDYFFQEDGTFMANVEKNGQLVWALSGKWSLEGETLSYEFTNSSLQNIPDGTTDRDKLIEVTKDYYVIEARDGSRRKYSRVTEEQ